MKNRSIALDALRGIAALCVVFFHAREINWVGVGEIWHSYRLSPNPNAIVSYLTAPFFFGFAAVSLFFVISGYCIHRPNVSKLAADPEYKMNLGEYFKRRIWRIYPVLIATLLLTFVFDYYTRANFPRDYKLGDNSLGNLISNLFSLQNIVGTPYGSNVPLWTLGMELHFYFLYPLLFWVTKKIGPIKTVLGVLGISLISLAVLRLTHSSLVIFLPFWFTWMVGFFIAECEAGRCSIALRKWTLAIFASLVIACLFSLKGMRDLADPFFAIFFGAVVFWCLKRENKPIWEIKVEKWFAYVGIFSYSLYAIHYPFLIFLKAWLQGGDKSSYIAVPILFTLLSMLVAYVLFWAVERWSLKLPSKLAAKNASQNNFQLGHPIVEEKQSASNS